MIRKTMDGNEAAAYAAYAFTEFAAIYPITPSSPMAEAVDRWAAAQKKNIFGEPVKLVEMQSEAGAVSAVHGALDVGTLATSFTSSQGLMLMIPTMFRIAGQLKPCVIHVASRNVATNNISIFAEHSDVMACRQTGFAMLCSDSVQQAMDLAAVAHLSAIEAHVPFLHFFDGFRTSHEIQKIDCLDYEQLKACVNEEELLKFRKRAMNPERPATRTSGLSADTYFQAREAENSYYEKVPDIVESNMQKINQLTGRDYHLFNYYGAMDAEYVLVGLGSVAGTAQMTVDHLNRCGKKVGYLEVHLFRPFDFERFCAALPKSIRALTVLDRDKEPGAVGEPLYEEVATVLKERMPHLPVYACRFGLASKDTTPGMLRAAYENMAAEEPKNHYTLGISDDVTHHSLPFCDDLDIVPEDTISCKFWGLGSDGTVGANKNSIKIIGDHTDKYVQAYFEYDGKKSGGVTKSHLRFGDSPIRATYLVNAADFVACHNASYIGQFDITSDLKPGGKLLLSCEWGSADLLTQHLPAKMRRDLAEKNIALYVIDANRIGAELGLGKRTNTILQAAFFKITNIIPAEDALHYMKSAIDRSYGSKGEKIVSMNYAAVEAGMSRVARIEVPQAWAMAQEEAAAEKATGEHFIDEILTPVNAMRGDKIPVSSFLPYVDGTYPAETAKFEKRGTSVMVPRWNAEKCLQCNMCSYVCPHATIRPFLLTEEEAQKMPEGGAYVDTKPKAGEYQYTIGISMLDCQGCGSCVNVCPAKALQMVPAEEERAQIARWSYLDGLSAIHNPYGLASVKGSQFAQPLLQFNGACAGCGQTPYAKLVTQLYGERMYIATATGCSQVWSTSFPSFPYSKSKRGFGPAVSGSLFENNAEFGYGMYLGAMQQRQRLLEKVAALAEETKDETLRAAAKAWMEAFDEEEATFETSDRMRQALSKTDDCSELCAFVKQNQEHLVKKSVWFFGGDGWAYDIGYGGLDHVLSSGENVNVMVFDTEVYSNTGGQASKATPSAAIAQFATAGKRTKKKDLGMMAMSYGDVYVAQVAMGANPAHFLKTVREAQSYPGPSLIICYAPCINHGLKCGMADVMGEMARAVKVGYWHLYHYDPRRIQQGENPFVLDSKPPQDGYQQFLQGEVRYSAMQRTFPELAESLYQQNEQDAKERYETYRKLSQRG